MSQPIPSEGAPVGARSEHRFAAPGPVTSLSPEPDGLTFRCDHTLGRLRFLADGLVQVVLSSGGDLGDGFSYGLDPDAEWAGPSALNVEEVGDTVALRTASLEVRLDRATGRLGVFTLDGHAVLEDAEAPAWHSTDGLATVALSKRLRGGERLLGLGDKTAGLDRRGGRYEHWNTDAFAFERGTDPIYKTIPFVLGITAADDEPALAYGLFVDTPVRSVFDLGAAAPDVLRVEAEAETLTYYVIHAPTPVEIVQRFTRLTGRPPLWPKWALGYHQCRYSYRTADEVRAVARGFRERGIPCDALYFDIHYMDGYRVFTWDRDAFPDPDGLLRALRDDGFHTVVMVDPGIKADEQDYAVAQSGIEHDAFCRHADGALATGTVWPGACYFPDYTDPAARRWWGDLHADLVAQGVDGVWNDMNEPALFNPDADDEADVEADALTLPADVRHAYEGRGAAHAAMHNVYGGQMVRATWEGLRRLRPARRPFVITRAAYAGTQRWATGWTGDNSSTWDHLRLALQQALSLNVSGFAFVGADVGGFVGAPTGELLARWTQLGALMPFFRNHSGLDTPPQEPWAFGPEVERVCHAAIALRYRLLPYFYTALHRAAADGTPILRPLALEHPDDTAVRLQSPAGFYVGDRLLAYPALRQGQAHADVYLPVTPGGWFDFWSGAHHESGQTLRVETPLGALPLWVRAGTVLPLAPVRQTAGEPFEALTLRVYPADGDFTSVLYDDAGDGWDFERGGFYRCTFHGTGTGDALTVRPEVEGQFPAPWTRWEVEVIGPAPAEVTADGEAVPFEHHGTCVRFTVRPSQAFTVRY